MASGMAREWWFFYFKEAKLTDACRDRNKSGIFVPDEVAHWSKIKTERQDRDISRKLKGACSKTEGRR